jgi:hypothetical protein
MIQLLKQMKRQQNEEGELSDYSDVTLLEGYMNCPC